MATGTTFIIYNTAGQPVSAIQPNTLDGPEGVQQNSDLRMYGLGYPNWGEGVNENDFHIVENFACPPLSNYPTSARYILLGPVVSAKTPAGQAADELGSGNGINVPLIGQLWFNTVQNKMFVNTAAYPNPSWTTVGTQAVISSASAPLTPQQGDLWYDTVNTQLKIWSGAAWVSVAAHYLPLSGGTMTGTLTMSGATIAMGGNKITGLATGTLSQDAVNLAQMNSAIAGAGALYLPTAGGTMTGALNMNNANLNVNGTAALNVASNQPINYTGSNGYALQAGTKKIGGVANPTLANDAMNLTFADGRYVQSAGDTMTGILSMGSHKITNVTDPTVAQDAATKNYVDVQVAAVASAAYPQFLATPVVVYDTGVIASGTAGGAVNTGWVNYNAQSILGIPGLKAVILEGFYIGSTPGDGSSPNNNQAGWIVIRNNNTKGLGVHPFTDTYVLVKSNTTEFRYFNPPSSTTQGTFPIRQVVQGVLPAGSFDYNVIPSSGLQGAGIRIIGYYT